MIGLLFRKLFTLRGPYPDSIDIREAEERWKKINQRSLDEGCRCGRPATHVRRVKVVGRVPAEIWTCEEHVNVNGWSRMPNSDHYEPFCNYAPWDDEWLIHAPRRER